MSGGTHEMGGPNGIIFLPWFFVRPGTSHHPQPKQGKVFAAPCCLLVLRLFSLPTRTRVSIHAFVQQLFSPPLGQRLLVLALAAVFTPQFQWRPLACRSHVGSLHQPTTLKNKGNPLPVGLGNAQVL